MKMNYLLKNRESERRVKKTYGTAFFLFIFLFVFGILFRGPLSNFFMYIGHGFWQYENGLLSLMRGTFNGFFSYSDIYEKAQKVDELEIELRAREIENIILNEKIQLSEKFAVKDKNNVIFAGVLRNPPFSEYDYLDLDTGADRGVKIGDKVYSDSGYLIGEIMDAGNSYSKAKLYSSSDSRILIRVGTSTSILEANGMGDGNFFVVLPKGHRIKVGDIVYFTGFKHDLLGEISSVEDDSAKVFQYIFFRFPFAISSIDNVVVKQEEKQNAK